MSDETSKKTKRALKRFQTAKEGRKYEIDKFWQRSAFFWVFIAASFFAFSKANEGAERLLFSCFGLVTSLAWTLQNRGSKYWQEAWEQKVTRTEEEVLGEHVFHHFEKREPKGFWGAWEFSVSRLVIALSDFTTIVWLGLLLHTSRFLLLFRELHGGCIYLIITMATIAYCVAMGIGCYSRKTSANDDRKEETHRSNAT